MEKNFTKSIAKYLTQLKKLDPIQTEIQSHIQTTYKAKAIIFDIYGTLLVSASGDIDQAQIKTQYLKQALTQSGFTLHSLPDFEESALEHILSAFKQTIKNVHHSEKQKGNLHPEIQVEKIWETVIEQFSRENIISISSLADYRLLTVIFELYSNSIWPMPHMKEVLTALHEKGIVLGIVSNAQFYTPIVMNYFLSGEISEKEYICNFKEDLTVYSYKNSVSKPSDILFNKLIPILENNYHIKPHETIFVGNDMLNDIFGASKARLKTVLFAGDKRSLRFRTDKPECANLKPDFIITDLIELLKLI